MAASEIDGEVNTLFAPSNADGLSPDVMGELRSILRLHQTSPQELFYKWESYSLKMGSDDTKLDLKTARAFKVDVQETLEREQRGKTHIKTEKRQLNVAPRNISSNADVFGMYVAPMTR